MGTCHLMLVNGMLHMVIISVPKPSLIRDLLSMSKIMKYAQIVKNKFNCGLYIVMGRDLLRLEIENRLCQTIEEYLENWRPKTTNFLDRIFI